MSDEALLAGMASRDPDAAAAFVLRFQSRVYGLALTILGDPDEAEEAAQEVFVRAWRHAEVYEPAAAARLAARTSPSLPWWRRRS